MANKKAVKNLLDGKASRGETDLLRRALASGAQRELRLRRIVIASLAAAAIFLGLGGFGLVKSNEAKSQAATVQSNLYHVALALGTADAQKDAAQDQAKIALARQLSAQAQNVFVVDNSKQATAVLLAIHAHVSIL